VNRRELLLLMLVAAVACGVPRKPRRAPRKDAGLDSPGVVIVDDWSAHIRGGSQLRPSPLLVRGELVARAKEDELEFVDAMTLARVGYVGEKYLSLVGLTGDTLLGFIKRGLGTCEIDVMKGTTLGRPLEGPDCVLMDGAHLLPATASELYIARGNVLVRYRIADDHLREVGRVPLDEGIRDPASGEDQLIPAGDGRVLAPKGKTIQVYEVGKPTLTYGSAARSIAHLARGSGGRVWYSRRSPGGDIQDVVLARLSEGLPTDASISVAPWRVIHMASAEAGALAMLLFDEKHGKMPWSVVYLDDTGKERWRAAVEEELVKAVGINLNLSFVAVTAKRVVLAPPGHPLVAWDAATGAPIR
jgi:hypothetical protein